MGASSSINENTIKTIVGNYIDQKTYNTLKQKYEAYFKTMQMIDIKTDSGNVTLEDITQKSEVADYVAYTDMIADAQSLDLPTDAIAQLETLQNTTSGFGIAISKAKNDFETRVQNTLSQEEINNIEKNCQMQSFQDQIIKIQTGSGNVVLSGIDQMLSSYGECLGNTKVESTKATTAAVSTKADAATSQDTKGWDPTAFLMWGVIGLIAFVALVALVPLLLPRLIGAFRSDKTK